MPGAQVALAMVSVPGLEGQGLAAEQWIYGVRPVAEALEVDPEGAMVMRVSVKRRKGLDRLLSKASSARVRVERVEKEGLDALCEGGNHQGVALKVRPFSYTDFAQWLASITGPEALVVALDEVQDPMNLGAILRSAAAAGAAGVILPERRSAPVSHVAVRASAGVARRLPVCRVVNLVRALERLQAEGFWVSGAAADGGGPPWSIDFSGRSVVVLGSEGKGMRRLVSKTCDNLVTIPLKSGVESLNVSSAASMFFYEVVRQRALSKNDANEGG